MCETNKDTDHETVRGVSLIVSYQEDMKASRSILALSMLELDLGISNIS